MVGKKYVSKDDLEAFARKLTRRVSGSSVHGGGGNGGGGATDCYWTKVLNDIYYDDGIVGIRTMTDDVRDAELQWAVGAADVTKYTMGVDDDDSDAWLLCSGDILTSTQEAADLGAVVITYSGRLGVLDYGTAISHRVKTHLSDNTLAHVSHFHLAEGDGDDEASNPIQDICSDGTYYYITDRANHRIKKHRMSDGLFMWAVGGPASGTGNDEFNAPWGICTDGTYLYVADRTNLRIKKHLCSTGAYVAKVGSYGTGPNQFVAPFAICTDGVHLYITQNGGWPGRLEKYTCGLVYVGQMNDDGYVDSATLMGICVSGSYLYAVNNNWSNGTTVYALYKYSTALAFVAGYSKTGTADNEFDSPYGICTDGTHLYITETASPQIKKIKVSDFSFVAKIGSSGLGDDQFAALTGICANATFTYPYARELRTPILKAGLDGSYCDSYPLFRARDGFQLMEDGTVGATDYVGLYAPAAITASYSLTFPGTGPAAAGHFAVDAAGLITWGQNLITTASPNFAGLSVGTNDLVRGLLYLYGHDTGGVYGGTLICYTSADHDAVIGNYGFMVKEDDLLIGPDTNVDALLLDSNDDLYVTAGSIILPASEYLNFGGTLGSGGYGVRDNAGAIELRNSGGTWASPLAPVTVHDLLSATHEDTDPGVVEEGDIIYGVSLLPGWLYCKRITLPIPTANQTDFPLKVPIIADADIGAECLATGYDIRFTAADGVTLLSYERESFAVAGGEATGIFWVKSDVATAGTYIWCYYGNAAATDGADPDNAQDAEGASLLHMDGADNGVIFTDESGKTWTAAGHAHTHQGEKKFGTASGAFDGNGDDYISTVNHADFDFGADDFLVECQIYNTGFNLYNTLCMYGTLASRGWAFSLYGDDILKLYYTVDGSSDLGIFGAYSFSPNTWYRVAVLKTGGKIYLFVNGGLLNAGGTVFTDHIWNANADFVIGRFGNYSAASHSMLGYVDEFRISRDADRIKYYCDNLIAADGGLTWGAEETTARWTRLSKAVAGPTFDHVHTNQIKTDEVAPADLTITTGAAKTLVLGTAVYKDTNMAGYLLAKPASSAPGVDTFRSAGGVNTTIETYAFALNELVHGGFELQHDYKEGTDLVFHVHWQGIAAPTGGTDNVQWRLNYIVARDGVTLAAATAIDSPDVAIDTQYRCYRTDFAAIVGTNFKIGDQFMFTLTRVAAVSDDYAGDCLIETAGIHYQVDTLGSRAVATK